MSTPKFTILFCQIGRENHDIQIVAKNLPKSQIYTVLNNHIADNDICEEDVTTYAKLESFKPTDLYQLWNPETKFYENYRCSSYYVIVDYDTTPDKHLATEIFEEKNLEE